MKYINSNTYWHGTSEISNMVLLLHMAHGVHPYSFAVMGIVGMLAHHTSLHCNPYVNYIYQTQVSIRKNYGGS
jgi:hypothetical protein